MGAESADAFRSGLCGNDYFRAEQAIRVFMRYAYIFYFATLILLIIVEVTGHIGMGAQRWINLGLGAGVTVGMNPFNLSNT